MLQILAPNDDDLRGLLGEHLDGIVSVLGRRVPRQPPVADVQKSLAIDCTQVSRANPAVLGDRPCGRRWCKTRVSNAVRVRRRRSGHYNAPSSPQ